MEANKSKRSLASSVSTPCAPALTLANKAFTGFDSCHIEEGAFAAKFSSSPCSSSSSTSPASASLSRAVIAVSAALRRPLAPWYLRALLWFSLGSSLMCSLICFLLSLVWQLQVLPLLPLPLPLLRFRSRRASSFCPLAPLGRPAVLPLGLGAIARGGIFEKFE